MENNIMKWLEENWSKATVFLAVYVTALIVLFVADNNFALFLIWAQIPVYFLHQFEEYIYPGGFMEFFNTKTLGSRQKDFPLTKKVSFWINIPIIFVGFPVSAIFAGQIDIAVGIWVAYFSIINALSHVALFFQNGYNPGFIVSLFANIPVGLYTVYYFISHQTISLNSHIIGFLIAIGIQGIIMVYGLKFLKAKTS
jgi:hypothetical protein